MVYPKCYSQAIDLVVTGTCTQLRCRGVAQKPNKRTTEDGGGRTFITSGQ